MVEMIKAGIIDPAKVTKQALQNASPIAGLMLTTEALISEIKEESKADAGAAAAGMGGMYQRSASPALAPLILPPKEPSAHFRTNLPPRSLGETLDIPPEFRGPAGGEVRA